MTLSLREVERLLRGERLKHLRRLDGLLPPDQRTGVWANLSDLNRVIWHLQEHRNELYDWASMRAVAETEQRELQANKAELQAREEIAKVVEHFGRAHVRFGSRPNVEKLRSAYRELTDEVDRLARDRRNLGPSTREKHATDIASRGGVIVENAPDPVADAARVIREALPSVEASVAYARRLRSDVQVDPYELDDRYARILGELRRVHGTPATYPDKRKGRPTLGADVVFRLGEWGLLGGVET